MKVSQKKISKSHGRPKECWQPLPPGIYQSKIKAFKWLFLIGPNETPPFGYADSGEICDDEKMCKCVVKEDGCGTLSCKANNQEGMCIGKVILQIWHDVVFFSISDNS